MTLKLGSSLVHEYHWSEVGPLDFLTNLLELCTCHEEQATQSMYSLFSYCDSSGRQLPTVDIEAVCFHICCIILHCDKKKLGRKHVSFSLSYLPHY